MKPIHFVLLALNLGLFLAFGTVSAQGIGLLVATWALFLLGCIVFNGGMLLATIVLYATVTPYILCTMEFAK